MLLYVVRYAITLFRINLNGQRCFKVWHIICMVLLLQKIQQPIRLKFHKSDRKFVPFLTITGPNQGFDIR